MPVLQSAHPALAGAPAPRLATIRRLAQRCGISDGALRTALSRACAAGSLRMDGGRYSLGPLSIEAAAAARALMARRPGYVLAVVLEGEGVDLARLRELFQRQGLRPLQRSLWVGARTVEDRVTDALAQAGLGGSAVVFQADEVDAQAQGRLARLWNRDERAAVLGRFQADLMDFVAAPDLDPREAAWRTVQAAPIWYRTVVHDEPPFPLDLCGPDYPLDTLNAAWTGHLQHLRAALVELWREG